LNRISEVFVAVEEAAEAEIAVKAGVAVEAEIAAEAEIAVEAAVVVETEIDEMTVVRILSEKLGNSYWQSRKEFWALYKRIVVLQASNVLTD